MIGLQVKLKRKAAFLLAVVIMFTTAFVFPDFSYRTFAEESIVTEENINENTETNNNDVLISEASTEEDVEAPEENTEEIIEDSENILVELSETPTEEVTEEDNQEEQTDVTSEETTEDESFNNEN